MQHINSALTATYLFALDRLRTLRRDDGMSTIEYALVWFLHHESTHYHSPV